MDGDQSPELVFCDCGDGGLTSASSEICAHFLVNGTCEARDARWMPVPTDKIAGINATPPKRIGTRPDEAVVWWPPVSGCSGTFCSTRSLTRMALSRMFRGSVAVRDLFLSPLAGLRLFGDSGSTGLLAALAATVATQLIRPFRALCFHDGLRVG